MKKYISIVLMRKSTKKMIDNDVASLTLFAVTDWDRAYSYTFFF
jgi:hypothetical protein